MQAKISRDKSNTPDTMRDGLVYVMYKIMRQVPSYRVEHFWSDGFYASQFFTLGELITEEIERENKQIEKAKKGK